MSSVYLPDRVGFRPLSAGLLGLTIAIAAFGLLPLMHILGPKDDPTRLAPQTSVTAPIPDFLIEEPPPAEEAKELEKPVMEPPLPIPSMTVLELFFEPGDGGATVAVGGGFGDVSSDSGLKAFLVSELDQRPRALVAVSPLYPYNLRGISGRVVVEFIIDEEGRPRQPRIHSATERGFEQAALDAVLRSKWSPGKKDGKAVSTIVRLPVIFTP